ncbi:MAG TPA: nucleotidyl transferase AbiEii/AbiGii toxin family protein [Clostridia bacterium]|jgi:predicted nucleotidyltransferase component of viral defense system|nr:nucleotidyl transferase AbiEii/AbiGii toxin family protein [Clostridiaceae bacterium]HOF27419.1 nucleotidyl transferase AbiEii/AbiGii toxin family protein [Clostridia bacterium]HOR90432.1 nucleotidyl transferase AbiEii/AbiGii toxin family protein [Clostridia bacterium]HOT70970.1 nucleotidyl transferase AbiEii/AbiGii toxin family protein [Clostridia bacterium]HPL08827.1 nucleotidyl transferase AbiEii/AbiGii toxin family protein [Clostridia bacterium]
MIKTSRQLKDKIRNLAKEKSADAQILMRTYMMERLLERISISEYKKNFILKGGLLIASLVGLDFRSTMDVDTTIKGFDVNLTSVEQMIQNLIDVPLEDGVLFQIKNIDSIMEEAEYPCIRVSMQALFDGTITPLKIDISTGDVITPDAIHYSYKLMFEDRYIQLLSYNLETVLAEKLETIMRRHLTNTRMRDFYDVYILKKLYESEISKPLLQDALDATVQIRGSTELLKHAEPSLKEIENSDDMRKLWLSYQSHYEYAQNISWDAVMEAVKATY